VARVKQPREPEVFRERTASLRLADRALAALQPSLVVMRSLVVARAVEIPQRVLDRMAEARDMAAGVEERAGGRLRAGLFNPVPRAGRVTVTSQAAAAPVGRQREPWAGLAQRVEPEQCAALAGVVAVETPEPVWAALEAPGVILAAVAVAAEVRPVEPAVWAAPGPVDGAS
jgi:hypothetical protein